MKSNKKPAHPQIRCVRRSSKSPKALLHKTQIKLNIPPIIGIQLNNAIIGRKNMTIPKNIIKKPRILKLQV